MNVMGPLMGVLMNVRTLMEDSGVSAMMDLNSTAKPSAKVSGNIL